MLAGELAKCSEILPRMRGHLTAHMLLHIMEQGIL